MDLHEQSYELLSYRLRTARQKKRLQKEDFAKNLIRLHKLRGELWRSKHELPMVPLAVPYQKGWKRFFVLTEEARESESAPLYEDILKKINTVEHSPDKRFLHKRCRKKKKVPGVIQQDLRRFDEWSWWVFSQKLTEQEKSLFYREESWYHSQKPPIVKYLFREPWRFVLQIRPHIITRIKMIDSLLEQQSRQLDNYISTHHLNGKILKLTNDRSFRSFDPMSVYRRNGISQGKEPVRKLVDQSREQLIPTN